MFLIQEYNVLSALNVMLTKQIEHDLLEFVAYFYLKVSLVLYKFFCSSV